MGERADNPRRQRQRQWQRSFHRLVLSCLRRKVDACGRLGVLLVEYIQRDVRLGSAWNAGVFWLIFINDKQITLSKISAAFFDLENGNQELKSDLKDLYINSAVQADVAGNRKAVVIHVPYRLRKAFRKIHVRLVRELEKKFSGKDVILIASRRILRPPKKGSAIVRPRSRTLTAVHDAILEDVVYPAEIVGKRVRYRLDGSKIMKIFLDPKERNNTEYKTETFTSVYRRLCGKEVVFEYPVAESA
ncbi:Ribosomal protein S7e [Musa troglodytarum]|uniref:40S ribosomal protein S7 n=1 Tax=Musa troglodytarum TaxID=320322 RepID=A0A9E7FWE7_9LILI|nr:Ribosomal protein S7e [Musa troglodytarum]